MPDPTGTNLTEAEAKQINASAPISQTFKTGERLRNLRTDLQELREVGCTLTAAAEAGDAIAVTLQAQRDGADVAEALKFIVEIFDNNGDSKPAAFSLGSAGIPPVSDAASMIVTTDAAGAATVVATDEAGASGVTVFVRATPWPSGKAVAIELTFD